MFKRNQLSLDNNLRDCYQNDENEDGVTILERKFAYDSLRKMRN